MKNIFFYLIIFFMLTNCKGDNSQDLDNKNNQKVISKNRLQKNWKSYTNDSIKVNIPNFWKPKIIKDALLYVSLNENKHNLYYVILNYNTSKISCIDYVKGTLVEVSKKTAKFNYSLKRLTFQNTNKCYILELYTNENNVKYKINSLIYEVGNQIYDFSYKTLDNKNLFIKNKQTFYSVLFSFELNYDNIIDSENFVVKSQKAIKYKDL